MFASHRGGSFWRILPLLVVAALVGGAAGAGDLAQKIKAAGKIVIAQVDVESPPFFWQVERNGKKEWVGFEVDLGKLIAEKLGVKAEFLRLGDDYTEVCRAVARGDADIGISNLSDTEARREFVDFSKPYIVSRVAMLVDVAGLDRDHIDAIEPSDLNRPEVKVALTQDSAYAFVRDELMPKSTVVTVPQGVFEVISEPVLEGKAHVLIDDGLTLTLGMRTHPEYESRLLLHVFEQYDDPLSMCLPKGQAEMRDFLNRIIDEMEEREPVTLELLVDRYMK